MLAFKTSQTDHPVAQAITAYSKYLNLPACIIGEDSVANPGNIEIKMLEAPLTDAQAMRKLEILLGDRLSNVLLIAPSPVPGPIADALSDMPHVHRMEPGISASSFIEKLKDFVAKVDAHKDFFLGFSHAEELLAADKSSEALPIVKNLQTMNVDPYACKMLLARIHFAAAQYNDALKEAQNATRIRPRSLSSRSLVAAIYLKLGESTKAEKVMEKSLEVAEASIGYMIQLGDVYFDQGKVDKSKAAYAKAKSLDPNNKKAEEGLLAVSLLEGDFKSARENVASKGRNFDLARFCNLRAISLTTNRRFDDAEKMYVNTMGLLGDSKDNYKILFNLGLCLKKSGDIPKSITYLERCKASAPSDYTRVDEQLEHLRKLSRTPR